MRPLKDVYILGYGVYIPRFRIRSELIGKVWGRGRERLPIPQKAVAGIDEDSTTMACEAARYALNRATVDPKDVGALFVGTESPPYAVKPIATTVVEALGLSNYILAIDMEFACKAGTTAMICVMGLVASHMVKCGMAIGVDTAQGRPSDELEYTAGCGASALVLGCNYEDPVAKVEAALSFVTDTPDFWRREGAYYPSHAHRFTGRPAYFKHIITAGRSLMEELGLKPSDFDYLILHQPNIKFPQRAAKALGFDEKKLEPGLIVPYTGNTYAASSLMGLCAVLDKAKPGERILLISFGSGAGSDAMSIIVEEGILSRRDRSPTVNKLIEYSKYIDYPTYLRYRQKIRMG